MDKIFSGWQVNVKKRILGFAMMATLATFVGVVMYMVTYAAGGCLMILMVAGAALVFGSFICGLAMLGDEEF